MKQKFSFFLLLSLIYQVNSRNLNDILNVVNENFLLNQLRPLIPTNFTRIINFSLPKNECGNQLKRFSIGLRQGEKWALKMLDASAKPQSGTLAGNVMQIGNYDECLSINESLENVKIQGQYCTALFRPHEKFGKALENWLSNNFLANTSNKAESSSLAADLRKSIGFCLPSVCTSKNLQELAVELEELFQSPLHFIFNQTFCDSGTVEPFSFATKFAIQLLSCNLGCSSYLSVGFRTIFGGFASIILFSTLYEVLIYQKFNGKGFKGYTVFSLYSNSLNLFSTQTSGDSLQCLNGIRVLSMLWIIVGHRFLFNVSLPLYNGFYVMEWKNKIENSFIFGTIITVDSFFTISGLLGVYVVLVNREKAGKFLIPKYYLHRIIRLTPPLAMTVLFQATLLKYIGNGPLWPLIYDNFQKSCETNWWSTLFFLQNYINPKEQCLRQSWFLAVDTQLYFLAPVFLIPLMRYPKSTIISMMIASAICCGYVFEVSWKKNLGSTIFDQDWDQFLYIYNPTHARFPVYFIGAICGYFIYKTRNKPIRLSKLWATILWIFSLLTMLGTILGFSAFVQPDYNPVDSGIFNALSRPGWAFGLCTIIILCVNGYGGVINSFLSNKIFTVLIRLNYSIYLLHLVVMVFFTGPQREPITFSNRTGFHQIWGDYFFTVLAAAIWVLAFESPTIAIEKIIFGNTTRKMDFNGDRKNVETIVVRVENGREVINKIE